MLGYVPTGYGARPLADVLADVRRYLAWYGVDGIFFDEASSDAALLPYYRAAEPAGRGATPAGWWSSTRACRRPPATSTSPTSS